MPRSSVPAGEGFIPRGETLSDSEHDVPPRRTFLKSVVGVGAAAPFGPVLATPAQAAPEPAPKPAPAAAVGYVCFSRGEAAFVEALVNIMCPADEFTQSGVDCGLAIYMDRQLAGDFGRGAGRYARGPWATGKPQHGLQLPLTPQQYFKAGIEAANAASVARFGMSFDHAAPAQAEALLLDIAAGKVTDPRLPLGPWFNELVYPLFTQACFADPIYGGNVGMSFWKMIGYPGLPATHTLNMVQYRGKPFPGAKTPKSIADFS
jgi:gluconate 2-dehydrogenase gamma chain